jgi:hypothetical protein
MRASPLVLAVSAVLAVSVLALGSGCGKKGTLSPNRPPETVVFVGGDLDEVRHIVRLSWFGTDPDGEVARFEFKWIYEPGQAPAGYDSSAWFSTVRNESLFVVWTPSGSALPTFVIRAVDDEGTADPTPARQAFRFKNDPPTIQFEGIPPLPATTYPVATVRWSATDPDGNIANAHYLVWLDGILALAVPVTGNQYTIPPDAFSDGAGGYVTGPHTVYVQAIDDGGAASTPVSFTWSVIAPEGEVLLVDDVPPSSGSGADLTYRNALTRQLGAPPAYSIVNIAGANPFRSAADITATFGFFDSIIWYQENNQARSGILAMAEPAIRSRLATGGNVFVSSTIAVGTNGALAGASFLDEIVGADSVRFNPKVNSTSFSIGNGAVLRPGPAVPYDSLLSLSISGGVDALALRSLAEAAFLGPPIVLDSSQVEDWIVGVDRVPSGGTGRFVLLTFPLRFLRGTPVGASSPAPDADYAERTIRRVLFRFGHGTSP